MTQVRDVAVSSGATKNDLIPAGAVDRGAVPTSHAEAGARVTSGDLTTILGFVSPSVGYSCTSGATFRFQKRLDGGTFATSTAHFTAASTLGFVALERIQATQDDEQGASCDLRYYALWDGTNLPIVVNNSVDFSSAPTPAFVSRFFLGPIYVDDTLIVGVQSVEIDTGLRYMPKRADGEAFARVGSIVARMPEIRITFDNVSLAQSLVTTMFGNSLGGTIDCYFRKGLSGGQRSGRRHGQPRPDQRHGRRVGPRRHFGQRHGRRPHDRHGPTDRRPVGQRQQHDSARLSLAMIALEMLAWLLLLIVVIVIVILSFLDD